MCVCEGHTITEHGTHDGFVQHGGIYTDLYRTQASNYV